MSSGEERPGIVSASREIAASAEWIFELFADPAQQPRWDGNDNLAEAASGQRVRAVGDVFTMTLTGGGVRRQPRGRVRRGPAHCLEARRAPSGAAWHLWRWQLEPIDSSRTRVTHTYDSTDLTDATRLPYARATTADKLQASLTRLAAAAVYEWSVPLWRLSVGSVTSI